MGDCSNLISGTTPNTPVMRFAQHPERLAWKKVHFDRFLLGGIANGASVFTAKA
jgi:hypothetical protein